MAGMPLTNGNKALAAAPPVSAADTTLVEPLPRGRVRDRRAHQQPRARQPARDRTGGLRADAQPVEPRPHAGRIERRVGGRRRRRHGADRARLRRRRIDPHPGVVLRAGRAQAQRRVGSRWARCAPRAASASSICVSRTVRDTARLLDATHGPGVGDTVIAPPPVAAVRSTRSAPTPGACGSGSSTTIRETNGSTTIASTPSAPQRRCSKALGHRVEPGFPAVLADASFTPRFMAMWATNMALGIESFGNQLGRTLTADDVEPVNWAQAEFARNYSAVDLATAQAATVDFPSHRAAVVGRRLGPPAHADARRAARAHRRARPVARRSDGRDEAGGPLRAVHPTVQHRAGSRRSASRCTGTPTGCRSASSSSPPTVARTC